MFKNPRQKTVVSTKKSSPAHQGQSCSALHSPGLSAIQEACHVRADLLSVQDMSKNETHKMHSLPVLTGLSLEAAFRVKSSSVFVVAGGGTSKL